jgi:hypothetical protein
MHRPATLLLSLILVGPAWAQTPAERASRQLQQGEWRDRATEAGEAARGPVLPVPPPQVVPLEADRRSLQPDVGRPEEAGLGSAGGERPPSGSQNPQR